MGKLTTAELKYAKARLHEIKTRNRSYRSMVAGMEKARKEHNNRYITIMRGSLAQSEAKREQDIEFINSLSVGSEATYRRYIIGQDDETIAAEMSITRRALYGQLDAAREEMFEFFAKQYHGYFDNKRKGRGNTFYGGRFV